MAREMTITLPGNMRVDTEYKGFTIKTDQPQYAGGDGTAPAPYDLFLASLATCCGNFVVIFCHKRKIPYEDIVLKMTWNVDKEKRVPTIFRTEVVLPPDFPAKYEKALCKAVEQCTVKRTMDVQPSFEVEVRRK